MTRGNQRDIDRKRAEARSKKAPAKGMGDVNARKEKDAAEIAKKQKLFEEKKAKEAEDARLAKLAEAEAKKAASQAKGAAPK
ncbi:hypothetical protein DICPUDRAFT_87947 [Dictyostelium purpureum]|uniref:Small EDRK-rich factor-like N-terminal domain-containing protein n=1 Tax=Dictyostelium purpureum TaxID=5786 RepID=F0ZLE8_DICPU|nr:uncharacterized protein DICPUDRAFT_87947 [Dictyostelium purpureum]EGC35246.1 hypothetical protein DICPUDRAFT_87947 [Dictyostelium purpureum]|eukprot:XP_003288233.1 hypothetical protein DICPUDRAFT_87947 [Dictyostelium purpureum]